MVFSLFNCIFHKKRMIFKYFYNNLINQNTLIGEGPKIQIDLILLHMQHSTRLTYNTYAQYCVKAIIAFLHLINNIMNPSVTVKLYLKTNTNI